MSGPKRGRRFAVAVTALVLALSATGVPAAHASTAALGPHAQEIGGTTAYWQTQRTNAYPMNHVAFNLASLTANSCGGGFVLGIRNTSAVNVPSFAEATYYAPANKALINDNGNSWQPSGAFWVSTRVYGQGCLGQTATWSGTLTYNVRVY